MRKKVDNRVRILIENALACRHRALFLIVGDRGRDQVVNLHYLITKLVTQKPSVLWCYKKDLGFSSHRKKRMKEIKKKKKKGAFDATIDDPFELFVSSTRIRYCYYKETSNILGQTFGMCVLQDFEALTPNILCRTIETVQGGGVVCILLQTISSLRQLYTMTMDIHRHFTSSLKNTSAPFQIEPRFNERFLLSLADCRNTLIVDDELNILPLSRRANEVVPVETKMEPGMKLPVLQPSETNPFFLERDSGDEIIRNLKKDLCQSVPEGTLVSLTATVDQAKVFMSMADILGQKSVSTTISLTSARGRGKSASLGLAISCAIFYGYSNIFVTAPSPENLGTLFEFIHKGLIALDYKEHEDFEFIQGNLENVPLNDSDVQSSHSKHFLRVNVWRQHRQTIQYIDPSDVSLAQQAELLIIDEAATIPLPLLKKLLGRSLVILSSTVHGYEGTGRAVSLKLIQDLRIQCESNVSSRKLKELQLDEPIRYARDDPLEGWLNQLLCLYATKARPLKSTKELPVPSRCSLYEVNRRALFSYHPSSEVFLHNLVSLFVSSHYKNSPNDLLLLSDAPSHAIFVLLPEFRKESDELPDIFVAIHVAIEGALNADRVKQALTRGERPAGDLIPWTLSQNFVDEDFGSLNGVRIVRIATHPSIQHLGYGSEALRQLCHYFEQSEDNPFHLHQTEQVIRHCLTSPVTCQGVDQEIVKKGTSENSQVSPHTHFFSSHETPSQNEDQQKDSSTYEEAKDVSLFTTQLPHMSALPPLLTLCKDQTHCPIHADYLGVSFGLTLPLFKFYNRLEFKPVYIRQKVNEVTGEHSTIMLRCTQDWLTKFTEDFQRRFAWNLSSLAFSNLCCNLSLSLLSPSYLVSPCKAPRKEFPPLNQETIFHFFSRHDLLRLQRFTQLLLDRSMIVDLLPMLSFLVLTDRLEGLQLSHAQSAVLVAVGLQHKTISSVARELAISSTQVVALFTKALTKIYAVLHQLLEQDVLCSSQAKQPTEVLILPNDLPSKDFESELQEESHVIQQQLEKKRQALLSTLSTHSGLKKYCMDDVETTHWPTALMDPSSSKSGHIAVRVKKKVKEPVQNAGFSLKGVVTH